MLGRFSITGWMCRFFIALAASSCGFAQGVALSLSSGSGGPGSTVVLNLSVSSTSGNKPASVGWTISYSTTDFSSVNVAVGAAATAASKSISCNNTAGSAKCVAWGLNANAISNGVLATVSMTISGSTRNTSSAVSLSNGLSALPSSTSVATSTTGSVVTIVQSQGLTISGTISPSASGSGATVTLSGAASATTTADASGNYSFTGLANGAYTVTPSKSGFTFSPTSAPVTLSGASLFSINFTASAGGPTSALSVNYTSLNVGWSGTLITSPQTVTREHQPGRCSGLDRYLQPIQYHRQPALGGWQRSAANLRQPRTERCGDGDGSGRNQLPATDSGQRRQRHSWFALWQLRYAGEQYRRHHRGNSSDRLGAGQHRSNQRGHLARTGGRRAHQPQRSGLDWKRDLRPGCTAGCSDHLPQLALELSGRLGLHAAHQFLA